MRARHTAPLMTADEFLDWHASLAEGRWELIGGVPVEMMTGARRRHNLVAVNTTVALLTCLRGRGCDVMASDAAVRISDLQVRYPDVVVDCGEGEPDDLAAREPVLIVEIASPSTREFDAVRKLREYQSLPSSRYVLLIEPDEVDVQFYTRTEGGWTLTQHRDLGDVLPLPALGTELPLAEVYEGLTGLS